MKFAKNRTWRVFMSRLYGWGASLVIIGALFKIMHWRFADYALIIGMGVEAIVFFFSAFEEVPEDVDWKLVYPELSGNEPTIPRTETRQNVSGLQNITLSSNLDKLMQDANIGPELMDKLEKGLKNLSTNASRLAEISNAHIATSKYIQNMETASKSVLELSQSYKNKAAYLKQDLSLSEDYNATLEDATQSLNTMSESYKQSVSKAREHVHAVEDMTKNLSALNTAYELQVKAASGQADSAVKFEETIGNVVDHLNTTAETASKYKDEMERLNENIKALNSVYGNMLSAMNININR